jgi:hypothetical protein
MIVVVIVVLAVAIATAALAHVPTCNIFALLSCKDGYDSNFSSAPHLSALFSLRRWVWPLSARAHRSLNVSEPASLQTLSAIVLIKLFMKDFT